jgi:hypothetical protein
MIINYQEKSRKWLAGMEKFGMVGKGWGGRDSPLFL